MFLWVFLRENVLPNVVALWLQFCLRQENFGRLQLRFRPPGNVSAPTLTPAPSELFRRPQLPTSEYLIPNPRTNGSTGDHFCELGCYRDFELYVGR